MKPPPNVIRVVLQPGQRLEVEYAVPPAPVAREALTLEELATRQSTTVRTLRRMIARGKLPATKVGRSFVVRVADAETAFAPPPTPPKEETEDEAIRRRLRKAGILLGGR